MQEMALLQPMVSDLPRSAHPVKLTQIIGLACFGVSRPQLLVDFDLSDDQIVEAMAGVPEIA